MELFHIIFACGLHTIGDGLFPYLKVNDNTYNIKFCHVF